MTDRDPTFAELLARARSGDTQAIEQIAQLYEPDLLIAARVHLGPAMRPYLDSLDLVQSVHRSLMLGLRNDKFAINDPRSLLALALTMVRRKVARQWRRHSRQTRMNDTNPIHTLIDRNPEAINPAKNVEVQDALARLWPKLEAEDRAVLELRLAGYSTIDAARQIGRSPEAVRVRLHRLRKRLESDAIFADWLS